MIAEKNCLTVAQLTKYVKRKFDADPYLNRRRLRGWAVDRLSPA